MRTPRGRPRSRKAHGSHGDPSTLEAPPGPAGAAEAPAQAPPWHMLGLSTPGPAIARTGLVSQRLPSVPWPPPPPPSLHLPARRPPGPQRTPAWRPLPQTPPWSPGRCTDVECDWPRSSSASSAPTESGNRLSNQRHPTWPRPLPAWCFLEELRAFQPR